ncbi:hypothetical protein CPT_Pollock25 [Escherichia phage Pollock]|uniref:DUF5405 domain-containing protein n=1 Tax=Escherichia phage Pollock TaxID=1540097 RepID=A0A0A0YPV0_9CAUD|nr:replication initiation protein [Escherichia phage Pollock]AIX12384.1 hypothetical protein CPT_Pollock25 [Escherichia phage Pollock]
MAKEPISKLCIPIGDKYEITSNGYSYVLVEKRTVQSGVKAGTTASSNVGYFQTLGSLAKQLINKEVCETNITSLQQLNERIEELGIGIAQLLEQLVKQNEGK